MVDSKENSEYDFLNAAFDSYCKENGPKNYAGNTESSTNAYEEGFKHIGKYIDLVHQKFNYIRFDFFSNRFCYNQFRSLGVQFAKKEQHLFKAAADTPFALISYFKQYFPDAHITLPYSSNLEALSFLRECLQKNPEPYFLKAEFEKIISELDAILTPDATRNRRRTKKPQPKRILEKIGYTYTRRGNKKHLDSYNQFRIIPTEEESGSNTVAA